METLTCPPMPGLSPAPQAAAGAGGKGNPDEIDELASEIQTWITQIEALPDPKARELLQQCLRALLELYGRGLERVLQLVREPPVAGIGPLERLLGDTVVRGLLLVHGLHPDDLETRVQGALAEVRPYLQSHGGDVALVGLEGGVAHLRLLGTCHGCPSSILTMQVAIRRALARACPDLAGLALEEDSKPEAEKCA